MKVLVISDIHGNAEALRAVMQAEQDADASSGASGAAAAARFASAGAAPSAAAVPAFTLICLLAVPSLYCVLALFQLVGQRI